MKLAQSLQLEELVVNSLNPLRFCSHAIAVNFAAITRHFQLAYCYAIIENNSRVSIPVADAKLSSVEMFFPFDPYLLKR